MGSTPTPTPETAHLRASTDPASMTVPTYVEGRETTLGPRPSPASKVMLA